MVLCVHINLICIVCKMYDDDFDLPASFTLR